MIEFLLREIKSAYQGFYGAVIRVQRNEGGFDLWHLNDIPVSLYVLGEPND